ncbi:MAG: nitrous oxide reductase accessory protein NosL [Pseudomonadota bacterium]
MDIFNQAKGVMVKTRWILSVLSCCLVMAGGMAGAAGPVEPPRTCPQCGMDRQAFAFSRVLLTYDDGDKAGLCSIHCADTDMKLHAGRPVTHFMVADYGTRELIDARKAFWVMGGQQQGVMTSQPKWAFAREADARKFMAENGGELFSFDAVLKAAGAESGMQGHAGHDHGPGGQLLFNPAFGDDIYHTHPAGMWMFNYKFMHMGMDGLRDGTSDVATGSVGNNRGLPYDSYMMIPLSMSMDMHMSMLMYGITDRFTVMGMLNYLETKMQMLMDMSPYTMMGMPKGVKDKGAQPDTPMKTSGLGDTELRGIYKMTRDLNASLGLSLPTGDIDQEYSTMGSTWRVPYDMQLGSGTFDLKPAITLSILSDDSLWNYGGQAMGTLRLGRNDNDYSLGDSLKLNTWLQRALGPAAAWIRLSYNCSARIDGEDPAIARSLDGAYMSPSMPDADPDNFGGQRADGFIGASLVLGPVSIGVEGGLPLYQDLNGLQMKNEWYLTAGLQAMF